MKNNSLKNFQIKQKLGSGSYGVIFKAINKSDKSTCVLKQISLARMSEKAKKNAVNEVTIMGKLKHPFIVSYCDSFTEDRNLNIIMEFCDGGDLSFYLKQQNKKYLKEDKIWRFFIQICMGLEHIHKNKILHRDIKTLNIFLHKNEMVKIGDLGVAKMLNSNDFAHTMVGTPFYLSPELCEEKPYNQKSDIWALGCLLYQLCTFRHPFEAANQASLILKIIRGKYTPIPEFYTTQLKQMIDWCLERDYKRRPTANMILSKQHVKKMIDDFQFQKIIDDFTRKNTEIVFNSPKTIDINEPLAKKKSSEKVKPNTSNQKVRKILDNQPIPPSKPIDAMLPPKRPPQKVLDQGKNIAQMERKDRENKQKQVELKRKEEQKRQAELKRKEEERKQRQKNQDEKGKVLFGKEMAENKAEFIQNLQMKMDKGKQKKPPSYFEIPWKNQPPKSFENNERKKKDLDVQDKIIIHNKQILLANAPMPPKHSQPVQKVKMEKKIQPKVYQVKQDRPKGIIKSGGFSSNDGNNGVQNHNRKKTESLIRKSAQKPVVENEGYSHIARKKADSVMRKQSQKQTIQKNEVKKEKEVKGVVNSMKNLRKESEERPSYLGIKRNSNQGITPPNMPPNPSRNKKYVNLDAVHSKPPKNLSHKSTAATRKTQVTKQEQELVANLPDIVQSHRDSDSDEDFSEGNSQKQFKLNQVDHDIVLRKYEEMIDSGRGEISIMSKKQPSRCYQEQEPINQSIAVEEEDNKQMQNQQQQQQYAEQWEESVQIWDESSQKQKQQEENIAQQKQNEDNVDEDEIFQEDDQFYEVNKFNMEEKKNKTKNEWSYDEQPELPMMEETQTPFFEQANPYLADESTQQENLEDRKHYLQMKLKQNIKREDQINKLMQMKIEQCKAVVPKGFDEVLKFFRAKLNMDRDYTQDDEKDIQIFLSERNLTDERKFHNIYKIMHFQMELENTRKIIQSICKRLNELEK